MADDGYGFSPPSPARSPAREHRRCSGWLSTGAGSSRASRKRWPRPRTSCAWRSGIAPWSPENSPPETAEALARLQAAGYPREQARRMIGLVLALELTESTVQGKPFDDERYAAKLRRLPELPEI